MRETLAEHIYQHGYAVIDDFLDTTHYVQLQKTLKHKLSAGLFQPAKIGKQQQANRNQSIRTDEIIWLDPNSTETSIQTYLSAVSNIQLELNRSLFMGLMTFETHFAVYPPGSFYKKHVDQFIENNDRRISCVYYLNSHWESAYGGALSLYDKQDQLLASILPIGNRFVCFNSELPHEVCITQQFRYSITGWMKIRSN